MARHGPGVVKGPHHGNIETGEILEQYGIVEVIAMDIMKLDNIGLDIIDIPD